MSEEESTQTPKKGQSNQAYWQANLRLMGWLLSIWFIVSYGCGILFVDELDTIRIGGFKLGFWFAQQGSIYVFVVLIFYYVWKMNKLDREFDVEEE
jgi:putative solute:sodium symporter small subunit